MDDAPLFLDDFCHDERDVVSGSILHHLLCKDGRSLFNLVPSNDLAEFGPINALPHSIRTDKKPITLVGWHFTCEDIWCLPIQISYQAGCDKVLVGVVPDVFFGNLAPLE